MPGKGLPHPGLLSGVGPTASLPATVASYLVLLSSVLGQRAARALFERRERRPFKTHSGRSTLHYGDWQVDYNLGVRAALLRLQLMRGSGSETSCCLTQLRAGAAVVTACRYCLSGPSWTGGGRRESDGLSFRNDTRSSFSMLTQSIPPRFGCCPYLSIVAFIKESLQSRLFTFLFMSRNGSILTCFLAFCFLLIFGYYMSVLGV